MDKTWGFYPFDVGSTPAPKTMRWYLYNADSHGVVGAQPTIMQYIKQIIVLVFIINLTISFSFINKTSAEAPSTEQVYVEQTEDLFATKKDYYLHLVEKYADEYNVSATTMRRVIDCENTQWDEKKQSEIINKHGVREDSWGLSQIHLPSHPHITKEQAQDAVFSIEFMAQEFANGKQTKWSCYKKLYL